MPSTPAASPMRVLLADVAGAGRWAVAELLHSMPDVILVAEAGSAAALADELRRAAPDAVVIDDRLLAAGELGLREASVAMIVVGVDDDPSFAGRARRLGAVAWIPKEHAYELLPDALASVRRGQV